MLYPKFLRSGDRIGITAPSSGIKNRDAFMMSVANIEKEGYRVTLTDNVFRCEGLASTPADVRIAQLQGLISDPDIKMVWAATGGCLFIELLDRMDYGSIAADPKWYAGYSDITSLVLPITLKCDIATLYAPNAGAFDMPELHQALRDELDIISGKIPTQYAYPRHERAKRAPGQPFNLDTESAWVSSVGDFTARGRMLSACLGRVIHLIGTPYAPVPEFAEKYREDGIIWNFDNYATSPEEVFNCLWSMKSAGWFTTTRAVMISRVLYTRSEEHLTYFEAAKTALGDIPFVLETDTGHVKPQMTLINGSVVTLDIKGRGGSVKTELI